MRVTSESQAQAAILNIQSTYAKLMKLQSQISTGNQVQVASDDPVAASQILQNNTQVAQYTTNLTSIQSASSVLQSSASTLTSVQNLLASIKNTGLQAANSATTQGGTEAALAAQVDAYLNQMMGIANTQLSDGTYLFSGVSSKTPPYKVTSSDSNGQSTGISYQGSDQSGQSVVAKSTSVTTLLAGSSIFRTATGTGTSYTGTTGAKAGTGVDTATGNGTLVVTHTQTNYDPGSGVTTGTSSAAGDTVLGPSGANQLVINDTSGTGTSGTVSLNGGPPVAFTNADSDLEVTGPNGEVVYIDTTSITAGFNGTVGFSSDGELSVDGGTTTTPIDFSGNQAVTDSATGVVTNVDSSNIRKAGTANVDYTGQADMFQTLMDLRDTIANTQGLSVDERNTAINSQLALLDKFTAALAAPLGRQSSQAQFLTNLKTRTTSLQTDVKQATNNVQSTDMASAIVSLQQQQNLYQAGLQLTANMNQMSLLNFIK